MTELQNFRPRLARRQSARFDFERASVILLSALIRRQSRLAGPAVPQNPAR